MGNTKILNTRIQLRKGTEAEYDVIKDEYIPLKGEINFVDTEKDGLRFKVGDGVTKFGDIPYADTNLIGQIQNVVVQGYYDDGEFYVNPEKTSKFVPYVFKLYVDIPTSIIYSYDGSVYRTVGGTVPTATDAIPGIMKLYDTTGNNVDGTMTQRSITTEIGKKFVIDADLDNEEIVFTNN